MRRNGYAIPFLSLKSFTWRCNLQVKQSVGPFECPILNGRDLISSQIDFQKIGKITEHAVRFNPDNLIVIQNPVKALKTKINTKMWHIADNNAKI